MQSQTTNAAMLGIAKTSTGILGFDAVTAGGLPQGRTTLIVGGPGCGKTVFALQTLVNGAQYQNEPGIFVALEENSRQIIINAASFGWDIATLEQQGRLFFLDVHLSPNTIRTGGLDLTGTLSIIKAKADAMGARRIVFDSLDILLTLLDNVARERQELYRLHDWLSSSGLTSIVTARIGEDDAQVVQRYHFMQFMVDCVIHLNRRLVDWVSLRELYIVKYRGSDFIDSEVPFVINAAGVDVANISDVEPEYSVSTERLSSGIERLDTMLNGGYYRGSSILITGSPGTSKTTLSNAFAVAACRRGERVLYISCDETANEIVRNLASVNLHLRPFREAGLLQMHTVSVESHSAESHMVTIKTLIDAYQPECLVVDPISAMVKSSGQRTALSAVQRMLRYVKTLGITCVCTSLLETNNPEIESSQLPISTIADTWIHLAYVINGGERNRALTIVKSRGTNHSRQVRELILSDAGVTLSDVYTASGEVLMGTLRWEREQAEQAERERLQADLERKRRELEQAEANTSAQIEILRHTLEVQRAELQLLIRSQALAEQRYAKHLHQLSQLRAADDLPGRSNAGDIYQPATSDPPDPGTETVRDPAC